MRKLKKLSLLLLSMLFLFTLGLAACSKEETPVTPTPPPPAGNDNPIMATFDVQWFGEGDVTWEQKSVYYVGDTVVLTATPISGYKVDSVKANDEAVTVGTNGTYSITLKGDTDVVVTFVVDPNGVIIPETWYGEYEDADGGENKVVITAFGIVVTLGDTDYTATLALENKKLLATLDGTQYEVIATQWGDYNEASEAYMVDAFTLSVNSEVVWTFTRVVLAPPVGDEASFGAKYIGNWKLLGTSALSATTLAITADSLKINGDVIEDITMYVPGVINPMASAYYKLTWQGDTYELRLNEDHDFILTLDKKGDVACFIDAQWQPLTSVDPDFEGTWTNKAFAPGGIKAGEYTLVIDSASIEINDEAAVLIKFDTIGEKYVMLWKNSLCTIGWDGNEIVFFYNGDHINLFPFGSAGEITFDDDYIATWHTLNNSLVVVIKEDSIAISRGRITSVEEQSGDSGHTYKITLKGEACVLTIGSLDFDTGAYNLLVVSWEDGAVLPLVKSDWQAPTLTVVSRLNGTWKHEDSTIMIDSTTGEITVDGEVAYFVYDVGEDCYLVITADGLYYLEPYLSNSIHFTSIYTEDVLTYTKADES